MNPSTTSDDEPPPAQPAAVRQVLRRPDRPWYRWGLATWVAILLVAGAIGFCHWLGPIEHNDEYLWNAPPVNTVGTDYIGWPFLELRLHRTLVRPGVHSTELEPNPIGVVANGVIAALLLVWVTLVIERMDRNLGHSSGPQVMAVGVILAATVVLARYRESIWDFISPRLPAGLSVVFETAVDSRPGWVHIVYFAMSIALLNAAAVLTWYLGVALFTLARSSRMAADSK